MQKKSSFIFPLLEGANHSQTSNIVICLIYDGNKLSVREKKVKHSKIFRQVFKDFKMNLLDLQRTIFDFALEYYQRGWSIIPIIAGTKIPPKGFRWKKYQTTRPTEEDLINWFGKGKYRAMAVICGEVSGGLTIIDFDDMSLYKKWAERAGIELPDVSPEEQRNMKEAQTNV